MQELRLEDILSRVASLTATKTDAAIAAEIGVSPQTLANWKRRKSIPIEELHALAERRDISLDYLLLGKLPATSISICKEIRKALESRYSPYSGHNIDVFAFHLVRYYNQYAHLHRHSPEEERKRSLLLGMLKSRQSGLRGSINTLQGVLREPEYMKPESSKKIRTMLDEDESLLIEIDQILSDENKLKATIAAVWNPDDTDGPESDNEAASPGMVTQAETIITQNIKGSSHEIAGRDIVQKSGKRKKK